jgi:hypothetical protein
VAVWIEGDGGVGGIEVQGNNTSFLCDWWGKIGERVRK